MHREISLFIIALALAGCSGGGPGSKGNPAPAHDELVMWVGADADALVKCSVANQCGDGDSNYGLLPSLSAGGGQLEHSRSYVRFLLPNFAPGTKLEYAQLELYHGGKNEDGTSDDICMEVARATAPWSPRTVTWNDQPLTSTIGTETRLDLVSQGWSGANVTAIVQDQLADPDSDFGFVVFANANVDARKSFDSNSHPSRTANELGHAPRLLLSFSGDVDAITEFPVDYSDDTDLPFGGQTIQYAKSAYGSEWPADWQAAELGQCP